LQYGRGLEAWLTPVQRSKVQVFKVRLEPETSTFREFSKRRNGARIEELAHCNEPTVRDVRWSEAIAVGSFPFVEKVKSGLV